MLTPDIFTITVTHPGKVCWRREKQIQLLKENLTIAVLNFQFCFPAPFLAQSNWSRAYFKAMKSRSCPAHAYMHMHRFLEYSYSVLEMFAKASVQVFVCLIIPCQERLNLKFDGIWDLHKHKQVIFKTNFPDVQHSLTNSQSVI